MKISEKTIKRLTLYHCILVDYFEKGKSTISSREMATPLHIDSSQVRRDINLLKQEGTSSIGYDVLALKNKIEQSLSFASPKNAFIVGSGELGLSLATCCNFGNYGLKIVELVDTEAIKTDRKIRNNNPYHMEHLKEKAKEMDVEIAILTVPRQYSQGAADVLVKAGIKYIWNFTPTILDVPAEIQVRNENLMGNFLQFTYRAPLVIRSSDFCR